MIYEHPYFHGDDLMVNNCVEKGEEMNINIIDAEKEIRITRTDYEREYQEYLKACMFMVDPPSFEVWLARRRERRRVEGGGE